MGSVGATTKKTYALFHGSPNADIEEFDIEQASKNTQSGEHFLFFTDSRGMADEFSYEKIPTSSAFYEKHGKKGRVYEVEVTMEHPLDLTHLTKRDAENLIKLSGGELDQKMIAKLSAGNNQLLKTYLDLGKISQYGYDGFIAKMDNKGHKEYAVLKNDQVKIVK